jgi:cytochrome P450
MSLTSEPIFNPLNPAHFGDAHERMGIARKTCPVSEFVPGLIFLARDADVRDAFKNIEVYSNVGNFELAGSNPPVVTQMDPPRHTQMRSLLQTALNTREYRAAASFIKQTTDQLLDKMAMQGHADIMEDLAIPLPLIVTSYLIGVPEEHGPRFRTWAAEINATVPHDPTGLDSWHQFKHYIQNMIDQRRALGEPPDDLITRLMQTEIEDLKLNDDEIGMAIFQLIVAGSDTVTFLLGNLLYELLCQPQLWRKVQHNQALIPQAIEESLRHDPPLSWVMRTCKHKTTIENVEVEQGKRVVLSMASANRDEVQWKDPDAFLLERQGIHRHLSFGYGAHFCLGAELARLEARIVLETLFDRLPTLHLGPDFHYTPTPGAMVRGPRRLDVGW